MIIGTEYRDRSTRISLSDDEVNKLIKELIHIGPIHDGKEYPALKVLFDELNLVHNKPRPMGEEIKVQL